MLRQAAILRTNPDVAMTHDRSPDVPVAPFVAGEPKQVLILAYQRTGSTFFSEIFDTNPDVFFLYEPLDGLYNAIYGTRSGWVVPTDIYHFPNGSTRLVAALSFCSRFFYPKLPVQWLTQETGVVERVVFL